MGLSSSQARLLSLTGRMHDIEYKAQKIEAQKLQMANESTRAYEDYLNALEMSKIQFGTLTSTGDITYKDATLAELEKQNYHLKDILTAGIYVSPTTATKYNLDDSGRVGDLDVFLSNVGFYKTVDGYTAASNLPETATYTPIKTSTASKTITVDNIDPNIGAQSITHTRTSGLARVSDVSTFTAGQTYAINTKDDLVKLKDLTNGGTSTAGVNFILGANIDLDGVDWNGIGSTSANSFKGTFDGNGYSIKNLTGTTGLFQYVTGNQSSSTDATTGVTTTATQGIIKNVTIENATISNRDIYGESGGEGTGCLVGKATGAYINNCSVKASSLTTGHWTGGLVGWNVGSAISDSSVKNITVDASSCCIGGFVGHDTNGIISNCISTGSVSGSSNVGGFIGHETSNGATFIYKCATTSTVAGGTKGSFIGCIDSGCSATIIESQASDNKYLGGGGGSYTSNGGGATLSTTEYREISTTEVSIPSYNNISSNLIIMLSKSGQIASGNENAINAKVQTWLNTNFYGKDLEEDAQKDQALKLASINNYINSYISNDQNPDIVNKLYLDIMNNTITNTADYQNDYVGTRADYPNKEYTAVYSDSSDKAHETTNITIPSTENIANNIYTALHNAGFSEFDNNNDVATVFEWAEKYYSTDNLDKANLNSFVTTTNNTTELKKLKDAILSDTNYVASATYTSKHSNNTFSITVVPQEQESLGERWDTSNPDIKEAIDFYNAIKDGYILTTEEQANSIDWLVNMNNSGTTTMYQKDIKTGEYIETSVSTNTSLQEVSNESALKKAEAKYEADMRKIDAKDRKYDTDLAALDTERNAIKQEIETLKTVAKENVERTFKLFS